MSGEPSSTALAQLPAVVPVFPLTGALLLPRAHLPLQIFEPRYLSMVEDALAHGRVIGMLQPRAVESDPIPDDAEIYQVGCAGRIVSFAETDDGRFLITLRGVCRFQVIEELPLKKGYRRVAPNFELFWQDLEEDKAPDIDRACVIHTAGEFLRAKGLAADWSAVEEATDDELIAALAMTCPFQPREKQALLECAVPADRVEMLMSLFEMAIHEADTSRIETRH
jgi:hypothetical protein